MSNVIYICTINIYTYKYIKIMDKQELTLFKLQLRKDLLTVILQGRYNIMANIGPSGFNETIAQELAALEEIVFKDLTPSDF